jgi:hypothetical protein
MDAVVDSDRLLRKIELMGRTLDAIERWTTAERSVQTVARGDQIASLFLVLLRGKTITWEDFRPGAPTGGGRDQILPDR